eukprot:CAMPEP_0172581682 /NCGR_PEP_ID=MMETSP1068-20121228/975_1 /TAXON_ID=35684 /ORGANISM="Pseudopedinella elastica, Strain CCMP716" /LENGTH=239 /DNA_ID=CAMNT_0013374763 /DNA_START=60 /DNA_END=779 /DNA_ORIENTATION=+
MAAQRLLVLVSLFHGNLGFAPQVHPAKSRAAKSSGSPTYWHAKPWWKVWASESGSDEGGDDITNSKAFLAKKLEVLNKDQAKLAADLEEVNKEIAAENEEWGSQIKQLNSEFTFLQQRTFNESRDAVTNARVEVVKELMEVVDNMNRARTALVPEGAGQEAIIAYYGSTFDKIEGILGDFGVTPIPTVGEEFNPELMEAIMMQPSEEYAEDLVCMEYQKGYVLGERLIRAAMVVVSSGM